MKLPKVKIEGDEKLKVEAKVKEPRIKEPKVKVEGKLTVSTLSLTQVTLGTEAKKMETFTASEGPLPGWSKD